MSADALRAALQGGGRDVRRWSAIARLLPALALGVAGLAVAAWLARAGRAGVPLAVVLAWALLTVAVAAGVWVVRRGARDWWPASLATHLEALGASRRGALTTLLDPAAGGTSPALHAAARASAARHVATTAATALAPTRAAWQRRARLGGGALVGALLALVLARPLDGTAAMVWRPWQAWSALTAPVQLTTTTPSVARGAPAELRIRAWGQRRATLRTRAPGEAWQEIAVALDANGEATVRTPPLGADLVAVAAVGARRSAEVRIAVRLPAFLGAFSVTAEYPRYLGLDAEVLSLEGDTVVVPSGTRLRVEGRTTTPLASASLEGSTVIALDVAGDAFVGSWVPAGDGRWALRLDLTGAAALEGVLPAFAVRVVADSAPRVEIPIPGRDTVAPPSLQVPVVVSVRDDHGIAAVALEVWHGGQSRPTRVPLGLPEGTTDRALLTTALDLAALRLGPGDSVQYRAVGTDRAPGPGVGRSPTYTIRVPTAAEQRIARQAATEGTAAGLDSLATRAKEAQRTTEDLARARSRGTPDRAGGGQSDPLAAEAARRAEQAAEAQEALAEQAEALRDQVEALRQAAERSGQGDSALANQLAEIRDLLERAMTPELREAMAAVREAARNLDAERTRQALRDLAEEQAKMRQNLEQARELFERAALETELASLADAARELAAAQREAAKQLAERPAEGAATEDTLAAQADALAKALEASAEKMPSPATQQDVQETADQARQAGEQMRQAAAAARQGRQQQAKSQAESAGEMMEAVERQIRTDRESMQEAMRTEVSAALERLLAETSRLLQRQLVAAEAYRRGALGGPLRTEQSLLEEGAAKLFQQVIATAGKNALVSPRIASAVVAARTAMRAVIEATATATPNLGLAAEQAGDAVDALAVAAHALLQSKEQLDGSSSGSGMQEAMQQMQQMAGQQGQLSRQGQGMMEQGEGGLQQMLQLAMQQRAIAQQLERLQAGGQMPGAGELAQEAMAISRSLEAGRLTPETAQRQERLFRRMLDAGRSLEGDERDERKERQSEVAREGERRRPPALDLRLRGAEVPVPGWEELQQLRPEERRRVLEYFRRLAGGGA